MYTTQCSLKWVQTTNTIYHAFHSLSKSYIMGYWCAQYFELLCSTYTDKSPSWGSTFMFVELYHSLNQQERYLYQYYPYAAHVLSGKSIMKNVKSLNADLHYTCQLFELYRSNWINNFSKWQMFTGPQPNGCLTLLISRLRLSILHIFSMLEVKRLWCYWIN